jgi:hypothetical protein
VLGDISPQRVGHNLRVFVHFFPFLPARMRVSPVVWVILVILVGIELAVIVPVVVTQKAKDESLGGERLQKMTNDLAARLNKTVASFMYNVARAAAAAPTSGFLSQRAMEDAILINEDQSTLPPRYTFGCRWCQVQNGMGTSSFMASTLPSSRTGRALLLSLFLETQIRLTLPRTRYLFSATSAACDEPGHLWIRSIVSGIHCEKFSKRVEVSAHSF